MMTMLHALLLGLMVSLREVLNLDFDHRRVNTLGLMAIWTYGTLITGLVGAVVFHLLDTEFSYLASTVFLLMFQLIASLTIELDEPESGFSSLISHLTAAAMAIGIEHCDYRVTATRVVIAAYLQLYGSIFEADFLWAKTPATVLLLGYAVRYAIAYFS